MRLFATGILGMAAFALWIYCIFDVISTDEALIQNMPNKMVWLMIVLFLPTVGAIAWLILGRPYGVGFRPGSTTYRATPRPLGPDDSPQFMTRLGDLPPPRPELIPPPASGKTESSNDQNESGPQEGRELKGY